MPTVRLVVERPGTRSGADRASGVGTAGRNAIGATTSPCVGTKASVAGRWTRMPAHQRAPAAGRTGARSGAATARCGRQAGARSGQHSQLVDVRAGTSRRTSSWACMSGQRRCRYQLRAWWRNGRAPTIGAAMARCAGARSEQDLVSVASWSTRAGRSRRATRWAHWCTPRRCRRRPCACWWQGRAHAIGATTARCGRQAGARSG